MEAKKALAEIAIKIDFQVKKILQKEAKTSSGISPIIKEVIENFYSICFGGKRLRGAFAYYSYSMYGGDNKNEIIKVSAVLELAHSYLLAHDDVMDSSDMRHRKPTLHNIYENIGKKHSRTIKNAKHFGESIAVNIGDVICHLGFNTFNETNFADALKLKALSKIHREFADTGYGQIIDCFSEILDDVNEDHVMLVHYYKTGKYTYETPLHVGALLAGATNEDLNDLTRYAIPGGIAFQIQDDILGMFGDEYKIGKPADSDLKEGKKTLLIIKAYERADKIQKKFLDKNLGNTKINTKDLNNVRKVITDTGSLDYSRKTALKLVGKAKNALKTKNSKWIGQGKDFLEGIADYMIKRDL